MTDYESIGFEVRRKIALEPPDRPQVSPLVAALIGLANLGLFAGAIVAVVWTCMIGVPSALDFLARWAR